VKDIERSDCDLDGEITHGEPIIVKPCHGESNFSKLKQGLITYPRYSMACHDPQDGNRYEFCQLYVAKN
jgi:hypothetical protein